MMTYSRQSEQILHRNEKYILECETILFGNLLPTFQRSSLLLSSVSSKKNKLLAELVVLVGLSNSCSVPTGTVVLWGGWSHV